MSRIQSTLVIAALAIGAFFAPSARAANVNWSVNLGFPVVAAERIYAPAPVYYPPPAPVYYQPAPVYYQPPPVVVYRPEVVPTWQHRHGHHPHHRSREYRDEYGDRYRPGRW
jgi:hypothetical protein